MDIVHQLVASLARTAEGRVLKVLMPPNPKSASSPSRFVAAMEVHHVTKRRRAVLRFPTAASLMLVTPRSWQSCTPLCTSHPSARHHSPQWQEGQLRMDAARTKIDFVEFAGCKVCKKGCRWLGLQSPVVHPAGNCHTRTHEDKHGESLVCL